MTRRGAPGGAGQRLSDKQRGRLAALLRCGRVVEAEPPAYAKLRHAGLVSATPLRPAGVLLALTLAGRALLDPQAGSAEP